ncbi:metallophosphoesterase [Belnapia sp. F-4-1]|uniref:metallophosphoesterase family protein n=1 Tax=Belnapia sp. F-4-1 TaxID=1545443 RepID=UPI0005BBEC93|nr:metallophosphoesterase [Belnapia sp. F-4-1]
MHRIAHISDLHFGAELPDVVAALAEELNRDPPHLIAISGDLTMRARRSEFRAARAFIDGLQAPVLVVPGNHDITPFKLVERFLDPYARWRRFIAPETEPVFQDGRIGVVGLNTARRAGFYLDWSRGRVGSGRLARCEARLAALPPGLTRIVVAHHPFLPPRAAPEARLVGGAAMALESFARQGVRLVLSGHLHVGDVAEPAAVVPDDAAKERLTVVLSATSTSHRLRGEPNAFNDIRIDANGRVDVVARIWTGQGWRQVAPRSTEASPAQILAPGG